MSFNVGDTVLIVGEVLRGWDVNLRQDDRKRFIYRVSYTKDLNSKLPIMWWYHAKDLSGGYGVSCFKSTKMLLTERNEF